MKLGGIAKASVSVLSELEISQMKGTANKNPIAVNALVVADGQRGRIDKCHPCRFADPTMQIGAQDWQGGWNQLHKAGVIHQLGGFTLHMLANVLRIVCLGIVIMRLMEADRDGQHFAYAK